MMKCDPVTGVCMVPEVSIPADVAAPAVHKGLAVHYVASTGHGRTGSAVNEVLSRIDRWSA